MARIEAPKRLIQPLALGERTGLVGHVERVHWRQLDLDQPPSTASNEIQTRVDRQSVEPGVESSGVTEARQIAPGTDEALLNRILGEVRVAQDQPSGCVQPPEGAIDERGKGVMIASLRLLDELSLIHDRLACGTANVVVLNRVWRRRRAKRSSELADGPGAGPDRRTSEKPSPVPCGHDSRAGNGRPSRRMGGDVQGNRSPRGCHPGTAWRPK